VTARSSRGEAERVADMREVLKSTAKRLAKLASNPDCEDVVTHRWWAEHLRDRAAELLALTVQYEQKTRHWTGMTRSLGF
jgi:hypothetical protein